MQNIKKKSKKIDWKKKLKQATPFFSTACERKPVYVCNGICAWV